MNPITALMLSRAIEAERRREIESRSRRFVEPELTDRAGRADHARRWLRLPRVAVSRA